MSEEKIFMRVDEVAETLGISKSHAYKIVRKYFMKKLCYSENETGG